jgi:aminoglycoside phosphotransferase (APT) family kinase protein
MNIDIALVQRLVATQFPQWAELPIRPVKLSGWDNRTFHLGREMSVRLPSAEIYARAVQKEQEWLPKLAPHLPFSIPEPVAMGNPGEGYPWHWSIYRWLPGETAARENVADRNSFAADLAGFLKALQSVDPTDGPRRKLRGGSLELYGPQVEEALATLTAAKTINTGAAIDIWQTAIEAPFEDDPVWYHGDVAAGNLLVKDGKLSAVIDFGGLGVGDPACDMTIAWTLLDAPSRRVFRKAIDISDSIWNRGRGWALWKGMIVVSGLIDTNAIEAASSQYAIDQLIADHESRKR